MPARVIENLFAWLVIDPGQGESVLRRSTPIGTQPLIGDDEVRTLTLLAGEAMRAAAELHLPYKLAMFERVMDVTKPALAADQPMRAPELSAEDEAFVRMVAMRVGKMIGVAAGEYSGPTGEDMIAKMRLGEQVLLRSLAAHRDAMDILNMIENET